MLDIWIRCRFASKQLIAIPNNISCKWTPIVMLFTFVPFPNTIVFTIQRLKISGLEFGSEHSNKKKKYVAEGERLIISYCLHFILVGKVLQTQSCRNIRSYEWCIYIQDGKVQIICQVVCSFYHVIYAGISIFLNSFFVYRNICVWYARAMISRFFYFLLNFNVSKYF